ncbi:MAG TPA: 3-hydroxybutyrate oligomer hydrolase family protein [Burkholderiaceae bacterium]|nr:3-hydroxybutyrate oligomer hydrolase family protein [Burkholderiaceae bacterium]
MFRTSAAVLALVFVPSLAAAQTRCDRVLAQLSSQLVDAVCFESTDLTTTNAATTPANNSIPTLPAGAFTPQTDRATIAPSEAKRPPITRVVPGLQIQARFANDPTNQGRFLLRLPNDWNGKLVVAGASGTRSEFNGDFAWNDYVVQKGYAYASQNKGVLNLRITSLNSPTPPNALACRLNPTSTVWVNFYDNDDGQPFTRWQEFIVRAAKVARSGVKAHYGQWPRHTYAVGTSNGGYQVRRAVETAPDLFDGGVDWEGTYVDERDPNLLNDLPKAVLNWPDYLTSGFSPTSTAAKNIISAGYPPDIVANPTTSFWQNHSNSFWEVTQCQWQKRLDPTFDTYANQGTATYNYYARLSESDVGENMAAFATTGKIKRPLITVAGTMDALLPINHHARAYARRVEAQRDDHPGKGQGHAWGRWQREPQYRLYEVQNGNHIETYQDTFPQLELIMPHAQKAFDLLVRHVEQRTPLPPDQCIGRGGIIVDAPAATGRCAQLFVP